ncbi:MAG: hypothetical protein LBR81_07250 [Prevotellaceae bacterium]|jgi:hypothetical protein|nr:hypothetical protein [Prevotellaceae bacterium]
MTKKIFNLRNVFAIAICLAGMLMFNACSDDDKENNGNGDVGNIEDVEFGVTMKDGNVVETVSNGIYTQVSTYVYKNGVYDHQVMEQIWPSAEHAQFAYDNMQREDYESVTKNGNTVKIVYYPDDLFEGYTAEDLYNALKIGMS